MADEEQKVCIVNKSSQTMNVTVDNGNGIEEIRLNGHTASEPVLKSSLTPYTLGLAATNGHIKFRNA